MKKPIKKWKIVLISLLVIVIGAGSGFYMWWSSDSKLDEITLSQVTKGDVQKRFTTSAPVESNSKSIFYALNGVKAVDVKVKVGDIVHAGDVLATFDTSALNEAHSKIQSNYTTTQTKYDEAVRMAAQAQASLPGIEQQISQLEGELGSSAQDSGGTVQYIVSLLTEGQIGQILSSIFGGGSDSGVISSLVTMLTGSSSGSGSTSSSQTELTSLQVQKALLEAQMDETNIASLKETSEKAKLELDIYDAQMSGLQNGWKAEKYGIVSAINIYSGQEYKVETSDSSSLDGVDLSSLLGALSGDMDMAALLSLLMGSSSSSTSNSSSQAGIGMLVENYDEFVVKFSIGKYDMESVKVGQKAYVDSINKQYEAEVSYVSATAAASTETDINSIMSSITGTQSSSGSSAAGIVTIKDPDEGITIGFDVDISIVTDESFNTFLVPVEAIRLDKTTGERCVYTYNENTKTIQKKTVNLGISDDSMWEIIDGLEEGEQIVRTFSGKQIEDGQKVKLAK